MVIVSNEVGGLLVSSPVLQPNEVAAITCRGGIEVFVGDAETPGLCRTLDVAVKFLGDLLTHLAGEVHRGGLSSG